MRMIAFATAIAIVIAFDCAAAVAQDARLAGRLSAPTRARVDSVLAMARAQHLPAEPLVDRALEGVAKRAPEALIISAVERLFGELRVARLAFGGSASYAELTAGASALRAGATRANLERLRRLRPNRQLTIPAGVLADLVAAGVPADTGIAAVLALASNADDADYVAFRRNVEQDIALGALPAAAVGARLRGTGDVASEAPTIPGRGQQAPSPIRKKKP
ncbi:MAG: hypothetical protein ACT4O1_08860 [Gemmatimonadota bacterium]